MHIQYMVNLNSYSVNGVDANLYLKNTETNFKRIFQKGK